jgi:hypothetical protein
VFRSAVRFRQPYREFLIRAPPRVLHFHAWRPDLALHTFEWRSSAQAEQLASYSAIMLICAQLPNTSQNGEYELQERYSAPRTLVFKALRFTGDNFIKHNVIVRLLTSSLTRE